VLFTAREAGFSSSGAPLGAWSKASEQAAILLANVLILGGEESAELLRDELGVEEQLVRIFTEAAKHPLSQLIPYANAAFRLSFLQTPCSAEKSAAVDDLFTALMGTVAWAAAQVAQRGAEAEEPLLNVLDIAVRALFNHARKRVAQLTDDGVQPLVQALAGLLSRSGESVRLDSTVLNALQLTLVLPKATTFIALAAHWQKVPPLLLPILQQVEAGQVEKTAPLLQCRCWCCGRWRRCRWRARAPCSPTCLALRSSRRAR